MRKAAFLDRDGTIIEQGTFINTPEQMRAVAFLPGAIESLRALQGLGFALIIVTNQGGVAKGHISQGLLCNLHTILCDRLSKEGVEIWSVRHCPHYWVPPDPPQCNCRKPLPGMLHFMRDRYGINMPASIMIGDQDTDVQAGKAAGCGRSYRLTTWAEFDLEKPTA